MMKRQIIGLVLTSVLAPSAHALIDGKVDSNTASSPYAGVGAVIVNGGTFSGTLIGGQYVLTAAHVVGGASLSNISFRINDGGNTVLKASSVSLFSGYTGTRPGSDGVWHDDLAIIKLAGPAASSVPFYSLYTGSLSGKALTFVGYGAGGDGKNGVTSASSQKVKRVGRNTVDKLYRDDDSGSAYEVFQYDFDAPALLNLNGRLSDEAHFAGGDSGAAALIYDGGKWKIAGVGTYVGSSDGKNLDKYGAFGGGMVVGAYASWINSVIGGGATSSGALAPVPEAETWAMMLAGLGLIGFWARRRPS